MVLIRRVEGRMLGSNIPQNEAGHMVQMVTDALVSSRKTAKTYKVCYILGKEGKVVTTKEVAAALVTAPNNVLYTMKLLEVAGAIIPKGKDGKERLWEFNKVLLDAPLLLDIADKSIGYERKKVI
jgi:hypothetical protein